MQSTLPARWKGSDVDVTSIERHLSALWQDAAGQSAAACPVRTHLFNLVAYARDRSEGERIARLDQLSPRHASRAIICVGERSRLHPSIDAELAILCPPESKAEPSLCYDQILLSVYGRAVDHLASIVTPLLMPEIPTYLWWPGQPPFGHRMFHRMLSTADQLIIDSAQFDSPGDGLANVARLCKGRWWVNDFNWARLTPWREIIAQFFDSRDLRPYLQGIRAIQLGFGSGDASHSVAASGLLLLLGWVSSQLGWEPETTLGEQLTGDTSISVLQGERLIPVNLEFHDHGNAAAGRLMSLEMVCQLADRPPAKFRVHRSNDLKTVDVSEEVLGQPEIRRVVPLGIPSEEQLLAEELELAGHDTLYQTVVLEASRLAGREIWMPPA